MHMQYSDSVTHPAPQSDPLRHNRHLIQEQALKSILQDRKSSQLSRM